MHSSNCLSQTIFPFSRLMHFEQIFARGRGKNRQRVFNDYARLGSAFGFYLSLKMPVRDVEKLYLAPGAGVYQPVVIDRERAGRFVIGLVLPDYIELPIESSIGQSTAGVGIAAMIRPLGALFYLESLQPIATCAACQRQQHQRYDYICG